MKIHVICLLIRKLLDDKTILSHYVFITDLSSLLFKQNKTNSKLHYCRRCLQHFKSQERLDDHIKSCKKVGAQNLIFSDSKNKFIRIKNLNKNKNPAPFIAYADFDF